MRSIVVGTAGHIDHGKSALVQALTGTDPDRLKEEKARGITIELGFAHAQVGSDLTVSFVDVPGHERFVRTMLAGVGGIDAVLLVIAADESVMPQTREHFDICRVLNVPRGVVVLTKADAVDADTLELATLEARELVAGSFLAEAPILAVSALTGQGLDSLRQALVELARALPARPADGPVRLPIDRTFSMRGFGTVVTGTLVSGTLREDDALELLPLARPLGVRGIQVHGESRKEARAGERVAVNVSGVEVEEVPRGALAASPGALREAHRLDVEMKLLPGMPALKHGARVRLHQGTAEVLARVALPGQQVEVVAGDTAYLRLRLESPAVVTRGDRFILRNYSPLVTIGGGVVLDPDPPRGIRTARASARFVAMSRRADAAEDRKVALREMAAGAGVGGASLEALTARLGGSAEAVRLAAEALQLEREVLLAGTWVAHRGALAAPTAAMLDGVAGFHRAQPLAAGMPIEEARVRWFGAAPGAVFDRVVAALVEQGRVVARDTLALASHRVSLSPQEAAVHEQLDRRLRDAALSPPDSSSLGVEMGCPQPVVDRVLQLLVKQKRVVRLDTLVFHQDALDRLKSDMAAMKARAEGGRATVDVKAFKDTYQVSRKYAIPLLEYLDRERVTRRAGDVRIVL